MRYSSERKYQRGQWLYIRQQILHSRGEKNEIEQNKRKKIDGKK